MTFSKKDRENSASASTSIQPIPPTEELKKPCLDYAMSIIVSSALPNVICNNNAYMKNDIHNLIYTGNNS